MHTQLKRLGTLMASTALLGVASAGVFAPAASAQTNVALNAAVTGTVAGLPAPSCSLGSGPENAVDGAASNIYTDKWCVLAGSPVLNIALPAATYGWTVSKIVIKHAGAAGESAAYNTRAYELTGLAGTRRTTIASVTANTASQTVHDLNLANQKAIELIVVTPTQGLDPATRIYEVEVWAVPSSAPDPCTDSQRIVNPGFETGVAPWVQTGTVVKPDQNGINANGDWYAGLRYNGDSITQTTTTEPGCVNYKLTYKLKVHFSLWATLAYDKLYVTITAADGSTYTSTGASNLTETSLFATKTIWHPYLAPGTYTVRFWTQQDGTYPTHFIIDDVNLRPYY